MNNLSHFKNEILINKISKVIECACISENSNIFSVFDNNELYIDYCTEKQYNFIKENLNVSIIDNRNDQLNETFRFNPVNLNNTIEFKNSLVDDKYKNSWYRLYVEILNSDDYKIRRKSEEAKINVSVRKKFLAGCSPFFSQVGCAIVGVSDVE